MLNSNDAILLIEKCIDSLKRSGTISSDLKVQANTVILGRDSDFDSIEFITLITDIENKLEQYLKREVYIALDEIHGFNINNPSLSVLTLAEYIKTL